jgi:hypothetical protein
MYKRAKNRLWFIGVLLCLPACGKVTSPSKSNSGPRLDNSKITAVASPQDSTTSAASSLEDFKTKAVFELVNHQSTLIQQGSSKIVTESAVVIYKNGLMPGKAEGLEIQFFTKPVTEADQKDVLENEGRQMRKTDYAALVLFLDKENKIGQVNLSYVVPGTAVSRTVAWKPDDIKKYFSNYQFDGKRLHLKSNGTYDETDADQKTMSLAWAVDIDLPVFDRRKK